MKIRRRQDWPLKLFEFIEARRNQPFQLGKQDCCLLTCDAVLAMTDIDIAKDAFRGKYDSALSVARVLQEHGGVEAIAQKICAEYGFPEVPVAMAQRGFMVMMDSVDGVGPIMGICLGGTCAFAGPEGLSFYLTSHCRKAWRVG